MPPSVSVVIPTYNYGRFVGEAIESVLRQTLVPKGIVVVDDGSTDDTAAVVAGFGDRIWYIKQENAGVCAARNRGVAESRGEIIAFLDADDYWEPTSLEKFVARFAEQDDPGLVHCGLREFDSTTGETIEVNLNGGEENVAENLLLWEEPVILGPGTVAVRREAFTGVRGFDTRMKCGEDWDFCYRVARRYRVGFVPEPLINYRSHQDAAHHNIENMERGMAMFYKKAFATDDPCVLALRSKALGNYHKIMSGSYFRAGRYAKFASHAIRSIAYRPGTIGHFLSYPLRRLQ